MSYIPDSISHNEVDNEFYFSKKYPYKFTKYPKYSTRIPQRFQHTISVKHAKRAIENLNEQIKLFELYIKERENI